MKLFLLASDQFAAAFKNLMTSKGVPVPSLFKLREISKKISEEVAKYEEVRAALIDQYCEKDDKGQKIVHTFPDGKQTVSFKPDDLKEYNKKLLEAGNIDCEGIPTIKFSDLGDHLDLTPEDIMRLEFIVE